MTQALQFIFFLEFQDN